MCEIHAIRLSPIIVMAVIDLHNVPHVIVYSALFRHSRYIRFLFFIHVYWLINNGCMGAIWVYYNCELINEHEWMNERTNEWMNEWMNEWLNEWIRELHTYIYAYRYPIKHSSMQRYRLIDPYHAYDPFTHRHANIHDAAGNYYYYSARSRRHNNKHRWSYLVTIITSLTHTHYHTHTTTYPYLFYACRVVSMCEG